MGFHKAPRGFMKPLYRGSFAKSLGLHETSMQEVGLNLGHVINFTFMTGRSLAVRKLKWEDCSCRYMNILHPKHPSKGLHEAHIQKGFCEAPIQQGLCVHICTFWSFPSRYSSSWQCPYKKGFYKASISSQRSYIYGALPRSYGGYHYS